MTSNRGRQALKKQLSQLSMFSGMPLTNSIPITLIDDSQP
jgi:hypothetical protein